MKKKHFVSVCVEFSDEIAAESEDKAWEILKTKIHAVIRPKFLGKYTTFSKDEMES